GLGVALKIRLRRFTALDASLVAVVLLHRIAISSFPHWWGGHSYGPRFFSDMLPYLVYFLIPVVAWLPTLEGARREIARWTFAAAAIASVAIHAAGALSPDAMRWNMVPAPIDQQPARVWDWRSPQFLAGL